MEQDLIDKITDYAEGFLRYIWLGLCSWILAVTQPLEAVVTLLCWAALLDFVFGYGAARSSQVTFLNILNNDGVLKNYGISGGDAMKVLCYTLSGNMYYQVLYYRT